MRLLFLTTLLATLSRLSHEFPDIGKTEVKVGALFFSDEDDIELSFDEAFREMNNLKLLEVTFVTIKRFVPSDDSFLLQQLACELISDGVAAIFGPSSKASSDIVALIANTTGIPHLQYDWTTESPLQAQLNHRLSVNVAPAIPTLSHAYWELIKTNYEWKSFTLIYETEQGLARLQDLMAIKTVDSDYIKLRKISDYKKDYRVLWKEAREILHEHRIIFDCEPSSLETLLQSALEFNLLGPFRNWFFTHLDTHSSRLRDMYNESFKANITSVRLKLVDSNPYERKKTRISKINEIWGNQTMLPILIYDAVILFANSARNIIVGMQQYTEPNIRCETGRSLGGAWYWGRKIVQEMLMISEDDVEPGFKTENMRLNEYGQRVHFNLEIYKPTVNEPLAVWKSDGGGILPIYVRQDVQSSSTSQDFSIARKLYTVVTHFEEPYFMYRKDHENYRGVEKYEGYAVDLIKKLAEILDFDYDFMIVSGNGKYNPVTKEWDGIIRKLIDHHAQIGISDLTITQMRRQAVDFTVPFMQLGISILYYKTPPEPKDLFAFLQPFAPEVWIYMILTQLVMTLMFVFMARISNREWENPNPCNDDPDELENKWNTSNSFWLMIGSIMQQGCDILPRGPMRILTGLWWFFALMMLSTYTANLAAFLTSNKMQSSINGLDDLIDQDKVKYGTVNGGSTSLFFSESNDTKYHKAWNQMRSFQPSAFTTNNKEGVERVRKGKANYAFLMETTSMSYNIERNCDLKEIGSQIGEKHYGLAVPLGAEYRTNLSVSLLQLSEKGELYKLKNKWWKNHDVVCEQPHEVDGDELSIIELGGVFLVLGGGVLVAVAIGICEFLWNMQSVAVAEKVTPWEAFKSELLFVMQFWIQRKPLHIASSGSSTKSSQTTSRRSSAHSRTHSLTSAKEQSRRRRHASNVVATN